MRSFADRVRTRIIPAILTALGITFLAAGVLSFTNPVSAVPPASQVAPSPSAAPETPTATATPSPQPTVTKTPVPLITLPPLGSGAPSTPAPVSGDGVASRVRIAGLKIDLPIIKGPNAYPPCNVAMYHADDRLGQPGEGKSVYLYGHARTGMFLALLDSSKVSNGKKMIGMLVEVWTTDDQRYLYVITDVYRHQAFDKVFDKPLAATSEALWLQTSEGVGTQPKLLIKAEPLSRESAPHAEANPKARPVDCD